MSAAVALVPRSAAAAFLDAVRAELSKIVTLPATWLTIGATAALSAVLSLFFASQAGGPTGSLDVAMSALSYSQAGLFVLGDGATFPGAPVVTGTLVSATAYLTCMVVLSSALGSLTRRALPAAGALVLYLVVVSPMLLGKPVAFALPDIAGYTLLFTTAPEGAPAAPVAWLIVLAWTSALWAASTIVFRRSDV